MKLCKLLLAAMGATVLLGALVSSASARNFSVSEQHIRSSFSRVDFHFPEITTTCHVTLEGSLHTRTIAKTLGSLIGYITSAILGPCANGTATILRETLPWHVRYSGFSGTLPAITSVTVHVIGAAWRIRESGGIACLARSTTGEPAIGRFHIDASGHATAGIEGSIRTGFECLGIAGSFRSDSPQLLAFSTQTAVSVRLI
jgi:hypothetical protein